MMLGCSTADIKQRKRHEETQVFLAFLCFFLFLTACSNNEKAARAQLTQAQNLYEQTQYGSAKQVLDNLKSQYPQELTVRKEALLLMREIETKEQERNLIYCDSLLPILHAEADSMKQYFSFIKNSEYDSEEKYVDKTQSSSISPGEKYIRISVNELGEMALTGVYSGTVSLKHNQLRITNSDGKYQETEAIPFDGGTNYSFKDDTGTIYELVTYQKGRDNGVISFIYNSANQKLTMEYIGEKKQLSVILSDKEKKALVQTVDLAVILQNLDRLKKEKEKAEKRIEYLRSKQAQ